MKYNGNDVFTPFNAGLYGIDEGDSDRAMQWQESKDSILDAFRREYEKQITDALAAAGIKYIGLEYYSPKFYNFETDSIDLECEVADANMLMAYIGKNAEAITAKLKANKAYDGYTPTTASSLDELKNDIKWNDVDITAITQILSGIDFEDFDLYDHLEYDYPCETCTWIHSERDNYDAETQKIIDACTAAQVAA